jgi:hypothetical protein
MYILNHIEHQGHFLQLEILVSFKHQVALFAAAGVTNTTARPKILLILENGNI